MSVRILKIATCPTLSGKSTLTYHVGCTSDSAIQFRIYASNGGGTFSQEWITWKALEQHLKKQTEAITSIVLYPLFRGKSVNTPSFLPSVLKHEGIVVTMKGKRRQHELADPKSFLEQMKGLIDAGTDLDPDAKPRKTPIRKKTSRSRRRAAKKG